MLKSKALCTIALSCVCIWIFGHRLYEWFATGQLFISPKFSASHYVTFPSDHVEFLIGFVLYVFLVLAGFMMILSAIAEE
jgi:hypothetical protein